MINDKWVIDSVREKDDNGYLHVAVSNLTKEQIAPYIGNTLPGWKENNLEPEKLYKIYRAGNEIEKGAATFNGLPLMLDHWSMDAKTIGQVKDKVVGSLGTDARYEEPYLKNSIIVTDAQAIAKIEDGSYRELSASYQCDVIMEGGIFEGEVYDGYMTNIRGNHVALVPEGRAGHDVRIEDSALKGGEDMGKKKTNNKEAIMKKTVKDELEEKVAENETVEAIETKDEEPVDVLADEIREAMVNAGLDPEDKSQQKAFIAGMNVAKMEDECKDEDVADETKDECGEAKDEEAKDEEVKETTEVEAKDEDAEKVGDRAINDAKELCASLYAAAEEVAPFVGRVQNPFSYNAPSDIYKLALDAKHIDISDAEPSSYRVMVRMLNLPKSVERTTDMEDPINKVLMGIKSR